MYIRNDREIKIRTTKYQTQQKEDVYVRNDREIKIRTTKYQMHKQTRNISQISLHIWNI